MSNIVRKLSKPIRPNRKGRKELALFLEKNGRTLDNVKTEVTAAMQADIEQSKIDQVSDPDASYSVDNNNNTVIFNQIT